MRTISIFIVVAWGAATPLLSCSSSGQVSGADDAGPGATDAAIADGSSIEGVSDARAADAAVDSALEAGAPDGGCGAGATAAAPVAPSPGHWMWQGQQTRFTTSTGCACNATIALGVGDRAVCYAAATTGVLMCAGAIGTSTYPASTFAAAGETGVDQILVSLTANSATGNAVCVHETSGNARCMGDYNSWGQFGNGSTGASPTFVTWGQPHLAAIGTGTWDQLCALDTSKRVYCSGDDFGSSPVLQGDGGVHTSFWVTTAGAVSLDDTTLLRASESRTECTIEASGMVCGGTRGGPLGTPGQVVMGGYVRNLPGMGPQPNFCSNGLQEQVCWLESSGRVTCGGCDMTGNFATQSFFTGKSVLALGLNFYGTILCAVLTDGSIDCLGSDTSGTTLNAPQAPAGSVSVACQ